MRAVIQRVMLAAINIEGRTHSSIGKGLMILLGVETGDVQSDADWLCKKIAAMRLFADENEVMNLCVKEVGGELLVVSQFTLHADVSKGNRPSYIRAARPETAIPLYEYFVSQLGEITGTVIKTGVFGADMQVSLINDGPVTIIMDSKKTT